MSEHARRERRSWAVALLMMLPAAIPWATHFAVWKPYSVPTGYIQADMPVYMAKARAYFNDGSFHLFYANPSDGMGDSPRIYHQPWTFALGAVCYVFGIKPAAAFVTFWFFSAWGCCRVILALYREFIGPDARSQRVGLMLFTWGGGLCSLAGIFQSSRVSWTSLFAFDPFEGWWFLNLGRNLVYPTESLYHLLLFGCLLAAMRRRHAVAILLAALTAACSPFAGAELFATLGLWLFVEVVLLRNRDRRATFLAGLAAISAVFAYYYGVYLNRFASHRELYQQMSLPWCMPVTSELLAAAIVLPFAVFRIATDRQTFFDPRNRLLASLFVAAIVLSHHELVISPHQPIHFTRGYAWSALFLLGSPVLVQFLGWLGRPGRRLALWLFVAIVLSDNAIWFSRFIVEARAPERNGMRISADGIEVLRWLDQPANNGSLVLSEDERLGYLALAETSARSWVGHHLETPGYATRRDEMASLFVDGRFLAAWNGRRLRVVKYRKSPTFAWIAEHRAQKVLENRTFEVYEIEPSKK